METTTTTTADATIRVALTRQLVAMLHGAPIPGNWPVHLVLGEEIHQEFGRVAGMMIRSLGHFPAEREPMVLQALNWALRVLDEHLGAGLADEYVGRGFETEGILRLRLDDVLRLQAIIAYGTAADFALCFWSLYDPLY